MVVLTHSDGRCVFNDRHTSKDINANAQCDLVGHQYTLTLFITCFTIDQDHHLIEVQYQQRIERSRMLVLQLLKSLREHFRTLPMGKSTFISLTWYENNLVRVYWSFNIWSTFLLTHQVFKHCNLLSHQVFKHCNHLSCGDWYQMQKFNPLPGSLTHEVIAVVFKIF